MPESNVRKQSDSLSKSSRANKEDAAARKLKAKKTWRRAGRRVRHFQRIVKSGNKDVRKVEPKALVRTNTGTIHRPIRKKQHIIRERERKANKRKLSEANAQMENDWNQAKREPAKRKGSKARRGSSKSNTRGRAKSVGSNVSTARCTDSTRDRPIKRIRRNAICTSSFNEQNTRGRAKSVGSKVSIRKCIWCGNKSSLKRKMKKLPKSTDKYECECDAGCASTQTARSKKASKKRLLQLVKQLSAHSKRDPWDFGSPG